MKDNGLDDNTIIAFSTDNGAENVTWPDGGQTPFAGGKGTALEGGFRVPAIIRWPGKIPPGKVENGIVSGLDWFPTFVAAAGYEGDIAADLRHGKEFGGRTYKVHLYGYNQMDMLTGKGPSKRHEIFYLTETTLGAVRIDDYKYRFTDQPNGWLGATEKVDWPILVNLRLDPYERTGMYNGKDKGSIAYYNWFVYEFWRFVFVQQEVARSSRSGSTITCANWPITIVGARTTRHCCQIAARTSRGPADKVGQPPHSLSAMEFCRLSPGADVGGRAPPRPTRRL